MQPESQSTAAAQDRLRRSNKTNPLCGRCTPDYAYSSDTPSLSQSRLNITDFKVRPITTFKEHQDRCLFVVSPDVVGNAEQTIKQYWEWKDIIKNEGWKVAFVAQDGQESLPLPDFDVLFVGGSTEWKAGAGARDCIRRAKELEKWVHVGRVNSERAIKRFRLLGVNSVDGTNPIYAPNQNVPKLDRALRQLPFGGFE